MNMRLRSESFPGGKAPALPPTAPQALPAESSPGGDIVLHAIPKGRGGASTAARSKAGALLRGYYATRVLSAKNT
jgi:hypothetical protein